TATWNSPTSIACLASTKAARVCADVTVAVAVAGNCSANEAPGSSCNARVPVSQPGDGSFQQTCVNPEICSPVALKTRKGPLPCAEASMDPDRMVAFARASKPGT